jgi:flagellar basal-body rod protein FlgB
LGNTVTDAGIISALGRQMTRAVEKQSVAAGNLANLDTPGYRTQELQFDDALMEQLGGTAGTTPLVATDPKHFGVTASTSTDSAAAKDAPGLQARRDGNNVQLDRELLGMTQATIDFNTAQTVLAAKFRLVRYAINEGR